MKASTLIPLVLLLGSVGPTWYLVGINLVLVIFTVNVLFYGAILCWTGYSCQNKRQNALFWARKLKNFLGRGHRAQPDWGPLPSLNPRRLAPYLPTPSYFFTILTLYRIRLNAICQAVYIISYGIICFFRTVTKILLFMSTIRLDNLMLLLGGAYRGLTLHCMVSLSSVSMQTDRDIRKVTS